MKVSGYNDLMSAWLIPLNILLALGVQDPPPMDEPHMSWSCKGMVVTPTMSNCNCTVNDPAQYIFEYQLLNTLTFTGECGGTGCEGYCRTTISMSVPNTIVVAINIPFNSCISKITVTCKDTGGNVIPWPMECPPTGGCPTTSYNVGTGYIFTPSYSACPNPSGGGGAGGS